MYSSQKRTIRNSRNGFTLVEVLLSLSITFMIVLSLTSLYRLIAHSQQIKGDNADIYIGAKLASQYVLGTDLLSIDNGYSYIDYQDQEMKLEFSRGRLVKTPGYEILIHDIDDLNFYTKEDLIYMKLIRDDKQYDFLLTYVFEKRIPENDEVEQ